MKTEKNFIYVECSQVEKKRVKGRVIDRNQDQITVEMPTGYVMQLTKKPINDIYFYRLGTLEFYSNGKMV